MRDPILERYRQEILRLAKEHGARRVRIFGSRARGQATQDSDLDLLVSFREGSSLLDLIGLQQAVEDLVHTPVDVVSDRGLSPYLRDQILAEAAPL